MRRYVGQKRRPLWTDIRRQYQLHLIIALPILWFILFAYVPMYGAQIAFREFEAWKGIWGSQWVGFEQILRFLRSYSFWNVLGNTITLSAYQLIAGFPFPIILALALNNVINRRTKRTLQTLVYAPYFISNVVLVGILLQFLSPTLGVVNHFIHALGFKPVNFMGTPQLFKSIYVWSGVWQTAGWGSIIYLAALASVDPELHEAATVDGASRFQRNVHIDFPGILPTVVIVLILSLGQIMNLGFEKAYLMQNPLNLTSSEIIQTYVYKVGMSGVPQFSYAAAIGLFNSVINLILVLGANQVARRLGGVSLW